MNPARNNLNRFELKVITDPPLTNLFAKNGEYLSGARFPFRSEPAGYPGRPATDCAVDPTL
jgi:hypothetical protein